MKNRSNNYIDFSDVIFKITEKEDAKGKKKDVKNVICARSYRTFLSFSYFNKKEFALTAI
ncbi:TPA: hypothetical protein OOF39_004170 [Kluyvera ascorbata]|uniref:hypothetical protein n=1 Tax=Kluyvera ascorbata TaxID=51288 RepID=UPI0013D58C48|nr:hypothetical protein [Kluyvera ascorbata]HCR3984682.1 hypothetical protein [Kluyvera ascorbata]